MTKPLATAGSPARVTRVFFATARQKARRDVKDAIAVGEKIVRYRRDILAPAKLAELRGQLAKLRAALKDRAASPESLRAAVEALVPLLKELGGNFYPRTHATEWVEMIFVAAVLVIGLRAYFLQPFKIPTNSMYPSYNGLTHELFTTAEEVPPPALLPFRFAAFGAERRTLTAPADGELLLPVHPQAVQYGANQFIPFVPADGKSLGIFPGQVRRYAFLVGSTPARVEVPADLGLDLLVEEFLRRHGLGQDIREAVERASRERRLANTEIGPMLRTGLNFKKGDFVFAFDIHTGDALFVDRFSYHFFEPQVGDPFVFRTKNIEGITRLRGQPEDKYYIKRLVGVPGDALEVRPPALWRNGEPITGADAFAKNAAQSDRFGGYETVARGGAAFPMTPGRGPTIPPHSYFAMGDNSGNSEDSRFWGFVPDREVVGKALFIYHPFTFRWGPAK